MEEVAVSGEAFPKARRLLKRGDYARVQKSGVGAGSRNFVVIALARCGAASESLEAAPHAGDVVLPSRLGLIASRKTGNAVARNRGKRLVREWFRRTCQQHSGYDVVVVLRRGAPELTAAEAARELDNGLRRAIKKAMRATSSGAQRGESVKRGSSRRASDKRREPSTDAASTGERASNKERPR